VKYFEISLILIRYAFIKVVYIWRVAFNPAPCGFGRISNISLRTDIITHYNKWVLFVTLEAIFGVRERLRTLLYALIVETVVAICTQSITLSVNDVPLLVLWTAVNYWVWYNYFGLLISQVKQDG
jgi:hypothetical protein